MGIKVNANWRFIYLLTIGLRFLFALSDSYIHPDEHFQSMEVLANKFFKYDTTIPWEFKDDSPARSLGILYLFYGPLFSMVKYFNLNLSILQIWYLARLQLVIIGWIITDTCIYKLLPTKPERIKAVFFTSTSYITLVYQSHCFSNSIETLIVLVALVIIDDLRYINEMNEEESKKHIKTHALFFLGVLIAVGSFNRITFPAFILLPSKFLLQYAWKNKLQSLNCLAGFCVASVLLIVIDTIGYRGDLSGIIKSPFNIDSYVITPMNNLLYNSKYENLSQHGIHPFYFHVLANIPQLLGPGIIFLIGKGKNKYYKTTPFLSGIGAIAILSFIPHQELRFLIPVLPLFCCCFDLESLSNNSDASKGAKKSPRLIQILFYLWYIFNILMAILMGIYHQGGIIGGLEHLKTNLATSEETTQIWWRTYSPPTCFLESTSLEVKKLDDSPTTRISLSHSYKHHLIDAMGTDVSSLMSVINSIRRTKVENSKVYLITPTASFNSELKDLGIFEPAWNCSTHLDLDHLDVTFENGFTPGLGIFEII